MRKLRITLRLILKSQVSCWPSPREREKKPADPYNFFCRGIRNVFLIPIRRRASEILIFGSPRGLGTDSYNLFKSKWKNQRNEWFRITKREKRLKQRSTLGRIDWRRLMWSILHFPLGIRADAEHKFSAIVAIKVYMWCISKKGEIQREREGKDGARARETREIRSNYLFLSTYIHKTTHKIHIHAEIDEYSLINSESELRTRWEHEQTRMLYGDITMKTVGSLPSVMG